MQCGIPAMAQSGGNIVTNITPQLQTKYLDVIHTVCLWSLLLFGVSYNYYPPSPPVLLTKFSERVEGKVKISQGHGP